MSRLSPGSCGLSTGLSTVRSVRQARGTVPAAPCSVRRNTLSGPTGRAEGSQSCQGNAVVSSYEGECRMSARQRDVLRAVAARERARRRLRNTTASVGVAGVLAGGAIALALPGSTHARSSDASQATSGSSAGTGTKSAAGKASSSSTSGSAAKSSSTSPSSSTSSTSSGSLQSSSPPASSSGSSSAVSGGS